MKIKRLQHVTVMCADADESMKFYEKFLDLKSDPESARSSPDFAHLTVGVDQQVHLRVGTVPEFVGQHWCFEVDDLQQAIKECEEAGVPVRRPQNEQAKFAHILDPSGNDIELRQMK